MNVLLFSCPTPIYNQGSRSALDASHINKGLDPQRIERQNKHNSDTTRHSAALRFKRSRVFGRQITRTLQHRGCWRGEHFQRVSISAVAADSDGYNAESTEGKQNAGPSTDPVKTERLHGFVRYQDLDVNFGENFSYYIRKETINLLTNSVFPFLKKPEYAQYCNLDARRILLTGPPGSELYQQAVVKALARDMHANLFVLRPDESDAASMKSAQDSEAEGNQAAQDSKVSPSAQDFTVTQVTQGSEVTQAKEIGEYLKKLIQDSLGGGGSGKVELAGVKVLMGQVKPGATKVESSDFFSSIMEPMAVHVAKEKQAANDNLAALEQRVDAVKQRIAALKEDAGNEAEVQAIEEKLRLMEEQLRRAYDIQSEEKKLLKEVFELQRTGHGSEATKLLQEKLRESFARLKSKNLHMATAAAPVALGAAEKNEKSAADDSDDDSDNEFKKFQIGPTVKMWRNPDGSVQMRRGPLDRQEEDEGAHIKQYIEQLIAGALKNHQPSTQPYIIYIPDIEGGVFRHGSAMSHLKNALTPLNGPVVVIASRTSLTETALSGGRKRRETDDSPIGELLTSLNRNSSGVVWTGFREDPESRRAASPENVFPTKVQLPPPPMSDVELFNTFSKQMEHDRKVLSIEKNVDLLGKGLEKKQLMMRVTTWADQETRERLQNQVFTEEAVTQIVGYAASQQLREPRSPQVLDGYMMVDSQSLIYAIDLYRSADGTADGSAARALKDVEVDNKYEKALLDEVIPASEINVRFKDIGALENQKQALKEVVMLPLQRPELFQRGSLTKPVKGALLFGPPGTGKTLLAKAIATEAGANFINVTSSAVQSSFYGESEKYICALFTLARKLQPCVVFCDEVDSMLGRRNEREHDVTRRVKNEFMQAWDGLKTRADERVLVLGATNRPFDLDEAVLRRFPRRFLVDLPNKEQREHILKVILASEDLGADVDIPALALATEGYSGSDLKNLCVSAAYVPIREIVENENGANDQATTASTSSRENNAMIRPLSQDDFLKAKKQVSPSVSSEDQTWEQLRKWNELYGEGGSRKKSKALGFSLETLDDAEL